MKVSDWVHKPKQLSSVSISLCQHPDTFSCCECWNTLLELQFSHNCTETFISICMKLFLLLWPSSLPFHLPMWKRSLKAGREAKWNYWRQVCRCDCYKTSVMIIMPIWSTTITTGELKAKLRRSRICAFRHLSAQTGVESSSYHFVYRVNCPRLIFIFYLFTINQNEKQCSFLNVDYWLLDFGVWSS